MKANATIYPHMVIYALGPQSMTYLSPFPIYPTVTTSWSQMVQTFTVPANCNSLCISLPYQSGNQFYVDNVCLQYGSSTQPLVLQDMISVGPATIPTGGWYAYTSGTTTGITLNMVNTDTVAHSVTVVATPFDWQNNALTPVTVGTFNLNANSLTTTTYQLGTNLRGAFRLGFQLTSGGQTWQQLAQYKYAVGINLQNQGTASTSIFGMNVHFENEPGSHATENASVMAQCGVKDVRLWWGWGMCEATQGTFSFTEYDRQYNAINGAGMKVMPNVQRYLWDYEESWAGPVTSGSWSQYPYTSELSEWEVFVGKVAQHYCGNIPNYELWNEPEAAYPTKVTAAQYATLLNDTRPYIRTYDANADVVAFAGCPDTSFIASVLSQGVAGQMDQVSEHPYGQEMRPETDQPARISAVRTTMTNGGCPSTMPIWDTEVGIFGDGDGYLFPTVSEADIASLYIRNVVTAKSLGVAKYFWFAADSGAGYGFGTYYENYTPRPRMMALNATASFIEGLTWQTSYQPAGTTIYAHLLNGANGVCVLWSTSGPAQLTLAIPTSELSVYDTMGNALAVTGSTSSTFSIAGERPVFLVVASANYSTLNTAVSGLSAVNTAISLSYVTNSSTSITVTVTNQSTAWQDGFVSLIPIGSPSPWPANELFDSLAPGDSRSFTFTFTGSTTTANLSQISCTVGTLSKQTVTINYTGVPTAPPAVYDGTTTGVETPYATSSTQLSANWSAASDPQSGVTGYQYAIGTTAGGTNVVGWTSLGNVLTVTKTGLSLTNGQKYYFSVEAIGGNGAVGPATNSPGQTVDTTPPTAPPHVYDGSTTGVETSTTTSTTQLSANWSASTDSISGISGYQYAIGASAGGTNVVGWTSVGNVLSVTKTGLSLNVGTTYFFSVKATDNAGLVGSATNSSGCTVLSTGTTIYFQDNFEGWAVYGGAWSSRHRREQQSYAGHERQLRRGRRQEPAALRRRLGEPIRRLLDRELQPRDFRWYQHTLLHVSPHRIWDCEFDLYAKTVARLLWKQLWPDLVDRRYSHHVRSGRVERRQRIRAHGKCVALYRNAYRSPVVKHADAILGRWR